jgi:hypothetical protein
MGGIRNIDRIDTGILRTEKVRIRESAFSRIDKDDCFSIHFLDYTKGGYLRQQGYAKKYENVKASKNFTPPQAVGWMHGTFSQIHEGKHL